MRTPRTDRAVRAARAHRTSSRSGVGGPALLRLAGFLATGALVVLVVSSGLAAPAFATTLTDGENVPGSAIPVGTYTKGTPFSSGQMIEVTIPANTVLTPNQTIKILECSDPGGLPANDPTSEADCDENTLYEGSQGALVASNGSVTVDAYEVFALPDPNLGETPDETPVCNTSNYCVLYIGMNQENFSGAPYFLSQPFLVRPNPSDSGVDPGDGTPEAPLMIGLPLAGLGVAGGSLFLRRRRSSAVAKR